MAGVCWPSYHKNAQRMEKKGCGAQTLPSSNSLANKTHCLALPLGPWGTDPRTFKRDLKPACGPPGNTRVPNISIPVDQS